VIVNQYSLELQGSAYCSASVGLSLSVGEPLSVLAKQIVTSDPPKFVHARIFLKRVEPVSAIFVQMLGLYGMQ
jgi:hypothetical protein